MFGFAKKEVAEVAPVIVPVVPGSAPRRPTRLQLVRDNETVLTEYEALATQLNFHPSDLFERRVRNFLIEEDIPIYAYREVFDYMARLCKKAKKSWEWAPLEWDHETSIAMIGSSFGREDIDGEDDEGDGLHGGGFRHTTYGRIVPIEHLRNAKKIRDKFPKKVRFYISDYAVKNPDPFICAWWFGLTEPIVFGVWDEPGFGG